jgi:hypothetical protein
MHQEELSTLALTDGHQLAVESEHYRALVWRTTAAILAASAVAMVAQALAEGCDVSNTSGSTVDCNIDSSSSTTTTTTTNGEQSPTSSTPEPAPTAPVIITPVEPAPAPTTTTKPKHHASSKHHSSTSRLPHFYNYDQNVHTKHGYRWGARIAGAGCGPTAMAMVAATLEGTGSITPITVANDLSPKYFIPGGGTDAKGFRYEAEKYGIYEHHVNMKHFGAQVSKVEREGGLAIVHAHPGHFTRAGHYLVIKAVEGGKFRLADPNGKPGRDSEKRLWSASQLRQAGVDDAWTFRN